jgi:hypothetical protein
MSATAATAVVAGHGKCSNTVHPRILSHPVRILLVPFHSRSGLTSPAPSCFTHPINQITIPCCAGIVTTPFTWEQIKDTLATGDVHLLGRTAAQLDEYAAHKTTVLTQYCSVADYLLHTIFKYKCENVPVAHAAAAAAAGTCSGGSNTCANVPALAATKLKAQKPNQPGCRIVWQPNNFPYYTTPEIEMHIIWCEAGHISEEDLQQIVAVERPEAEFEVQIFENPPHLKSVPELHHVHVISRSVRGTL